MDQARLDMINDVKVKLEEFSPFENSTETGLNIVTGTTPDEDGVRPIFTYIDKQLDEAARDVLNMIPCTMILSDSNNVASWSAANVTVKDSVGYIDLTANHSFVKIYTIWMPGWYRSIHEAITPQSDPYLYEQQGNPTLRGKKVNPVVAIANGKVEIYSVDKVTVTITEGGTTHTTSPILNYVKATPAHQIQTDLKPLVVMQTAIKVSEIYGRTEATRTLAEEYQKMLQGHMLSNSRTTINTSSK